MSEDNKLTQFYTNHKEEFQMAHKNKASEELEKLAKLSSMIPFVTGVFNEDFHSYALGDTKKNLYERVKDSVKKNLGIPLVMGLAVMNSCGPEPVQHYVTADIDGDGSLDKVLFLESDYKRALSFHKLENGTYQLFVSHNPPRNIRSMKKQEYDVNNKMDDDVKDYVLYRDDNSFDVLQSVTQKVYDTTPVNQIDDRIIYKLINVKMDENNNQKKVN